MGISALNGYVDNNALHTPC